MSLFYLAPIIPLVQDHWSFAALVAVLTFEHLKRKR
jgi:hypothetical protein